MQKVKSVTLDGHRFQIGKLSPKVGSFILMRMMGAATKAAQDMMPAVDQAQAPAVEATPVSGADTVRALAMGAFFNGLDFEMFEFVQDKCLEVVSVIVADVPMPLLTNDGSHRIAHGEFQDNPGMLVRLSIEVLIFNLSDFFDQNAFEKMSGQPEASTPSHSPKT